MYPTSPHIKKSLLRILQNLQLFTRLNTFLLFAAGNPFWATVRRFVSNTCVWFIKKIYWYLHAKRKSDCGGGVGMPMFYNTNSSLFISDVLSFAGKYHDIRTTASDLNNRNILNIIWKVCQLNICLVLSLRFSSGPLTFSFHLLETCLETLTFIVVILVNVVQYLNLVLHIVDAFAW